MNRALIDDDARFDPDETPVVIASLAILGQHGDAELLLRHQMDLLSPEQRLFSYAHLAIAAASTGRYAAARRHLGTVATFRRATQDPNAIFFIHFGFAQYRYATGRLKSASAHSHHAATLARRINRPYSTLLSLELSGHLKAATGDARTGVPQISQAHDMALLLGRHAHARQLAMTRTLYEARYLLKPREAMQRLRAVEASLPLSDVFPQISVQLEAVRQELLRHRPDDARRSLERALRMMVGLASRRYEIMATMRLVDWHLATGAFAEAAHLAETASRLLDKESDDVLACELQQRKVGALTRLATADPLEPRIKQALLAAKQRYRQLLARTGLAAPENPKAKPKPKDPGLNHRQIALLTNLGDREAVDVHTYKQKYAVSEITACRDLAALARAGLLTRVGKARATRYLQPAVPSS